MPGKMSLDGLVVIFVFLFALVGFDLAGAAEYDNRHHADY
jgi:hypothetical protein